MVSMVVFIAFMFSIMEGISATIWGIRVSRWSMTGSRLSMSSVMVSMPSRPSNTERSDQHAGMS